MHLQSRPAADHVRAGDEGLRLHVHPAVPRRAAARGPLIRELSGTTGVRQNARSAPAEETLRVGPTGSARHPSRRVGGLLVRWFTGKGFHVTYGHTMSDAKRAFGRAKARIVTFAGPWIRSAKRTSIRHSAKRQSEKPPCGSTPRSSAELGLESDADDRGRRWLARGRATRAEVAEEVVVQG